LRSRGGHARRRQLHPDGVIECTTALHVEARTLRNGDVDLAENVRHHVYDVVTMVGQVHHDLISVTVLDDLDLTLCPSGLFLAAHLVGLKYAKKVWELRREVDCLFAPYLGVAANSAVQVHLWIDAEWGLHSDARNLVLEVRLDRSDGHAERVVVVAEGHLMSGVQLALLHVGIGNLGALAGELLRLVGGDDTRGAVDAWHRSHDLSHVSRCG